LAASLNLSITQFDIKTAYLNGDLEDELYMRQPQGFDDKTGRVCHLLKGLYGLKQAGRQWNKTFDAFLKSAGLKQSAADPCVYYKTEKADRVILCLYVDDGLLCCSNDRTRDKLMNQLKRQFEVTQSDGNCFVGLEIQKTDQED